MVEVVAHDAARGWLLTLDAGRSLDDLGNPPERWDEILPRYAELQRGETERAPRHLAAGVPDLGLARLPDRFDALLAHALPLEPGEVEAARRLAPRLEALVAELAGAGVGDTVDHADLHHRSVFADGERLRILDWGDASISHPFFTTVVTFHWLREAERPPGGDWLDRLRDAYLEPWGPGLEPAFALAQRLGRLARALAWLRHREAMRPEAFPGFDEQWPGVLRAAFAALDGS